MRNAVAILGAGTQGRRLAYMWSRRGRPVHLIDRAPAALEGALKDIEFFKTTVGISDGYQDGTISTFSGEELVEALKGAWLAVENVPESLNIKRSVVQQLDNLAHTETIVASNSSSFTIQELIDGLDLKSPSRCVSLHSYWPPETPAIEIMGSNITKSEIIPRLMEECRNHGFEPFHVKKESNGYIYNRIWAAIKREALFVAAEGVATPAEIDSIYKSILKTPKGPFEQMDTVGLDVVKDIEEHYAEKRNSLPHEPRDLLSRMIQDGKLGVKTGEGFYKY
ncbi:3-hydroxyacyl-CoA dehydrogenase [Rhexocercosporidium sp. MPI-PUGE-AT-0058]|nr:3-hydroxyacyl-CoA dehydrogenase [Rhexocercosporidium sp. MPI-PUGE-AT-0058]